MTETRQPVESKETGMAGEHPRSDAVQIILGLIFFAVWIADSFFLHLTTFITAETPITTRLPVAAIMAIVALVFGVGSHRAIFGSDRAANEVVRSGVFGIVRHPMYLSEILLLLAFLLAYPSLAAAVVWFIFIGALHIFAKAEERLLLARFGKAYKDYMEAVSMWFPRPPRAQ